MLDNFGLNVKVPILELRKKDDKDLQFLAQYIYEKIFLEYLNAIEDIMDKEEIERLKILQAKSTDINEQIEIASKIARLVKKRSEKNGRN